LDESLAHQAISEEWIGLTAIVIGANPDQELTNTTRTLLTDLGRRA
jgi:hypothetical protein